MLRVMLVCSAGMSTSLMVNKMMDAAKKQGLEVEITAVPEVDAKQNYNNADVVLLAPQVRFLLGKMKQELDPLGKPVSVIDGMTYGLMKGDAVMKQVLELAECAGLKI